MSRALGSRLASTINPAQSLQTVHPAAGAAVTAGHFVGPQQGEIELFLSAENRRYQYFDLLLKCSLSETFPDTNFLAGGDVGHFTTLLQRHHRERQRSICVNLSL